MKCVGAVLVLGMLVGAWAIPVPAPLIHFPPCDSHDIEEAAVVAVDYINSHQEHGYKYALARIEKAKVISTPAGGDTIILELDLLESNCHVLNPTPIANCTVRPKTAMRIEGDCDVAVKKLDGVLSVLAFKCKSEPDSREDFCGGCPTLLPLNHTDGLEVVDVALEALNRQANATTYKLVEVSRLTSQVIGGGFKLETEFVTVETNLMDDTRVPFHGFCQASTVTKPPTPSVDCSLFQIPPAPVAPATNDTTLPGPQVLPGPGPLGGLHHKLIHLHDPAATGLLSVSKESGEVPVVKRDVLAVPTAPSEPDQPTVVDQGPVIGGPGPVICPGRIRIL
ncbi:hypothetical protein COCON_G00066840 [Conger conger]|uniref:Cystatin fetuin-A-type domain-containing protein n=1 Tax=Conger conger TaxID=82655 RepID=A0A9Q1I452_CONCO|nr:alpha-2-HS-glycoprotein-like [Conger conger]KAJ8279618.1 hypothetical protein COCON_G00066840 [Conger conger]